MDSPRGRNRMQLLGRQAVAARATAEFAGIAVPHTVYTSEHNKPISTVRPRVQKHFNNEGVLPVELLDFDRVRMGVRRHAFDSGPDQCTAGHAHGIGH